MDVALEIVFALAKVGLATAAVALVTAVLWHRLLPVHLGSRFALPLGAAAGFCAGYWFLGEWTSFVPERHRQWLPWLAMAATVVSLVGRTSGPSEPKDGRTGGPSYVGWLAAAVLAIVSAWLLVPHWETLWPPRSAMVPLLTLYFTSLMASQTMLPDRLVGRPLVVALAGSATTVMLLIAIGVSETIGSIAAAAAGGMGGCAIAALLPSKKATEASTATAGRSLIPLFAVLIGGLAFLGTVEPQKPLPIILLAPAAPLMLWLFAAGPLAKLEGWQAVAIQSAVVALPLLFALVWMAI